MRDNAIHRLRLISVVEATSVLLFVIAVVVAATGGPTLGVPVLGVVTGVLALAYVVQTLAVQRLLRWSGWQTFVILAAAVVPFAPYTIERWLSDQERHTVPV